ncbi:hypothetical protein NHF48_007385 [Sphingomonas sp. H160509]|uniref:hypothetical protein n=1 Tax=Sphingomonas sp. H160509 TaxID=2955313 RepID=UPI00209778D8|nr:hypothetical protein [Sphingomonas sp. H160509]MDD1450824.1 hypothetical protein [Sphingomonas sp. H160509]
MKKVILLLSAAYLNGNAFVDAGATVGIGTDKHEITEERAVDIEKGLRGEISEVEDADDTDGDDDSDGFGAFTVKELKKYATDENIDLGTATTKADILAAIRAPRG